MNNNAVAVRVRRPLTKAGSCLDALRRSRIISFVLAVALIVSNVAPALALASEGSAPTLVSDKPDYAPGEVALLTGAGFEPGEQIDLTISIDDPETSNHVGEYAWTTGNAGSDGGFVAQYTIPAEAAFMNLTATAIGMSSGRVAVAHFTDNPWTLVENSVSFQASGNTIQLKAKVSGNPAPDAAEFTFVGPSGSSTVRVTTRSSTGSGQNLVTEFTGQTMPLAYGTTYVLNTIKVGKLRDDGSFNPNQTNVFAASRTTVTGEDPYVSPTITSAADKDFGKIVANSGTSYTATVTPADFAPVINGGTTGSVVVTFSDGTTSKTTNLSGNPADETFYLIARDNDRGVESATFAVKTKAQVYIQPVNNPPTISASDLCFNQSGTFTRTIKASDFAATVSDPNLDPTGSVTFGDGTTEKSVTFTAANPSHTFTLKVSDDPSGRNLPSDVQGAVPLVSQSATTTVKAVATINNAPTLSASDYQFSGTIYVTSPTFVVTKNVLASLFQPDYSDEDDDPVSLSIDPQSVGLSAETPSKPVTLTVTDDPSARAALLGKTITALSASVQKQVSASFEILKNTAPEITANNLNLGRRVLNGETRTFAVSPADFGAEATDPDGDNVGAISLDSSTVEFGWPQDAAGNEATVTKQVTLSVTDDPSDRNALL